LGLHVPGLADEGPLAVMDLGERSTDIVVLKAGEPVFGRTLSLGTTGLPESAASLAREVRLTLAAYRAQGGNAPTRLVLAGGGALVAGAKDFLQSELGLPVDFLPLPSIDLSAIAPERHGELVRHAKALSLAVGLGGRSRGLDLRRGPLIYERGWGWLRERVPLLFGLVAVVVVSFLFASWAKFHSLAKERVVLEAALGLATKEVLGEETTSASRAADLVLLQTTIADEDPMPHADAFDVLVKLSEDIPQSMKHDIEEFDFQKNHVVVHGVVGTIPDAESIVGSLKNERCLSDIRITRTSAVVGGDRQKYAMEFDLKCPEDHKQVPKKGAASASSASSGGK
ncbi:MAG: hypothetical protein WCI05_18725, partial [Myxococcales bacterium]